MYKRAAPLRARLLFLTRARPLKIMRLFLAGNRFFSEGCCQGVVFLSRKADFLNEGFLEVLSLGVLGHQGLPLPVGVSPSMVTIVLCKRE